jgi:hypothetical protein
MFGWGYAKETCISLFQKEQEEKAVTIYKAECLRIMAENTAKMVMIASGGKCEASYLSIKLQDILNPKPVDNRTAEDVIDGIRKKL